MCYRTVVVDVPECRWWWCSGACEWAERGGGAGYPVAASAAFAAACCARFIDEPWNMSNETEHRDITMHYSPILVIRETFFNMLLNYENCY